MTFHSHAWQINICHETGLDFEGNQPGCSVSLASPSTISNSRALDNDGGDSRETYNLNVRAYLCNNLYLFFKSTIKNSDFKITLQVVSSERLPRITK